VGDATPGRGLADQHLAVVADVDERRHDRRVLAERHHLDSAVAVDGGRGEGGADVDSEEVAHLRPLPGTHTLPMYGSEPERDGPSAARHTSATDRGSSRGQRPAIVVPSR